MEREREKGRKERAGFCYREIGNSLKTKSNQQKPDQETDDTPEWRTSSESGAGSNLTGLEGRFGRTNS